MKNLTLLNGLPIYKMMRYKVTGEKAQIVKVNPEVTEKNIESEMFGKIIKPLSVNLKVKRVALGIEVVDILEDISIYDLEVWNESMNPRRTVTYKTKKGKIRTVTYN